MRPSANFRCLYAMPRTCAVDLISSIRPAISSAATLSKGRTIDICSVSDTRRKPNRRRTRSWRSMAGSYSQKTVARPSSVGRTSDQLEKVTCGAAVVAARPPKVVDDQGHAGGGRRGTSQTCRDPPKSHRTKGRPARRLRGGFRRALSGDGARDTRPWPERAASDAVQQLGTRPAAGGLAELAPASSWPRR